MHVFFLEYSVIPELAWTHSLQRKRASTHRYLVIDYYSRDQKSIGVVYGPTMYVRIRIAQIVTIARKLPSTTHDTKSSHTTSPIPQSAWQS